jgi:hypothetical protein
VLRVEEIRVKGKEKEAKEAAHEVIKARNKTLRGKVGFANLLWKVLSMDIDIL